MKRPGAAVRALAARLCSACTMERLVDPTLADLQAEYENAVSDGRRWASRRIFVSGHIALIQVMAVHAGMRALGILRRSTDEDRRALIRTLKVSAAIMAAGTLVLAMVPLLDFVSRRHPGSAELVLYLIPQALPLSIPAGLTFGVLWGLGRIAASPRSRILILLLATMASVASFTMLAWAVPTANQAFRVSMVGRPVLRGANELTLGELRQLLEPGTGEQRAVEAPHDLRSLALNYHGRGALAAAPLVLALFAVALTSRRCWGRIMPPLAGCLAIVGYYVVMYSARRLAMDRTLSAFVAAWSPNLAFLILAAAVMLLGPQRANGPARDGATPG